MSAARESTRFAWQIQSFKDDAMADRYTHRHGCAGPGRFLLLVVRGEKPGRTLTYSRHATAKAAKAARDEAAGRA